MRDSGLTRDSRKTITNTGIAEKHPSSTGASIAKINGRSQANTTNPAIIQVAVLTGSGKWAAAKIRIARINIAETARLTNAVTDRFS